MAQGVSLGDDGNQVHTGAQALHHLDIEGLEGVASGADEVQTGVHTHVNLVGSARLLLLEHVGLVLVIQELDNGLPRVTVVDIVAKAGGIDDGQTDWRVKKTNTTISNHHTRIHTHLNKNMCDSSERACTYP